MNAVQILLVALTVVSAVLCQSDSHKIFARDAEDDAMEAKRMDEEVCKRITEKGEKIVQECDIDKMGISNDTQEIVGALRCAWGGVKNISEIKEILEFCKAKYPDDNKAPQCPLIKKSVETNASTIGEATTTQASNDAKEPEKEDSKEEEDKKAAVSA